MSHCHLTRARSLRLPPSVILESLCSGVSEGQSPPPSSILSSSSKRPRDNDQTLTSLLIKCNMECNHRHFLLNIADSISAHSAAPGSHRTTIPAYDAGRASPLSRRCVALILGVQRLYTPLSLYTAGSLCPLGTI